MNITSQIQGGLGNQLFQYATGKALSNRLGYPLQLDINWFSQGWEDVTPRQFLLPELKLNFGIAHVESPIAAPKRWRRIAQTILPISPYVLSDRPYRFNQNLNHFKPYPNQDVYLMGYWQSFRYFDSIRSQLISEIIPTQALSNHYQSYLEKIQGTSSALVHIRRGDYIHLPVAAKVHGFLGLEYYQKGMDQLLAKDPATQFFIFSDDLNWAKANLPYQERLHFIENANEHNAPVQELFLMSQCKRHLIANSSLSWWGAWLNSNPNPFVIAPQNWTNDTHKSWDDLLPPEWHRI
ncbi:alpha-1,2-fucosyltransferase [Polynucleobacter sp. es-EL-1]|uniref:alpha-1,2-fucosyltransferase n=1 Tax=Polynucleobacter sp. es-EL-1 TaxID=1855652 RepID=UPI001BFE6184|nr:alpha-1,2-fucosyltransferase [Polynucleobacter sp. es-EL-1]QWE10809.1 alpha-1,2-fucosyltransferase [Polynucleobacter sp. es-EL-1]